MRSAAYWSALAVVAMLLLISATWYAMGGRIYSVQTNSMRSAFRAGDAVLAWPSASDGPKLGEVISYRDRTRPGVLISHRVVERNGSSLVTKGDNNPGRDLPISIDLVDRRVFAVAPRLGAVLNWLRSSAGLLVVVYVPALLALAIVISQLMISKQGIYRLR